LDGDAKLVGQLPQILSGHAAGSGVEAAHAALHGHKRIDQAEPVVCE
jgi:hypothetical protein